VKNKNIVVIIRLLDKAYPTLLLDELFTSAFQILIATVISQRTRDSQTLFVSKNLFSVADTANKILALPYHRLEEIIRPAGKQTFNAKRIMLLCKTLLEKHKGFVPKNEFDLLSLPGVGRKTANIVMSLAYKKDAIAVDTHVHRIVNRLGWLNTNRPFNTELGLKKIIPIRYWKIINRIFVRHGQEICKPINPECSKCMIYKYCNKIKVKKSN
jgi:endonuclease-3